MPRLPDSTRELRPDEIDSATRRAVSDDLGRRIAEAKAAHEARTGQPFAAARAEAAPLGRVNLTGDGAKLG